MNRDTDFDAFAERLDLTYEIMGKTPAAKVISAGAKVLFFDDLSRFPLALVLECIDAHRQEGTFTPVPGDIHAQIERRRTVTWLSADEAWAQVPKLENQPGLLNDVSAAALAVALPLLADGKDFDARMAFKGAYQRLVDKAKLERRGPKYWLSPGGTQAEMEAVAVEAVRQGLLPASAAPTAPCLTAPAQTGRLDAALAKLQMKGPSHDDPA